MIVAFPGNKFRGEIAPALADLERAGTIRVIDLAFVTKDADGTITAVEIEDIDSEAARAFKMIEGAIGDLVNDDDLRAVGEELEPNSSAAVLVWEDVWAKRLATAISNADGELLDLERIPRPVVQAALAHAGAA
jgi:uncharacterized membrane protein